MIRTLKQLIAAANEAALTVTKSSIIRNKDIGIYWYEDRSIYRTGIRLDMAKQMTVKESIKFLGLE